MNKPYVRIDRWNFSGNLDMIVWGNGKDEWCKNLSEFTSFISVIKTQEEVIKFKQMFCDNIQEDLNKTFTIEDLDKVVTKKDYAYGINAAAEYTHIVETNIKCFEQGKEPRYNATSIAGDTLINKIIKKET
jgi:hypothetical protein